MAVLDKVAVIRIATNQPCLKKRKSPGLNFWLVAIHFLSTLTARDWLIPGGLNQF